MKTIKCLVFVGAAMVSGCFASAPVKPVDPVIKEVPVPVACVERVPQAPQLEHDRLGKSAPLDLLHAAALADKDRLQLYANDLLVQVKACAVIPKR